MQLLKVASQKHAQDFAKKWQYKKLYHVFDDIHLIFAADFANMIVTSFVETQMKKAAEAAKPKVVLTEEE